VAEDERPQDPREEVVGLGAALDEAKLAAATWAPPGRRRHLVPSQPTFSYSVIRFGFG
jgi:hypothetical protein